MHYKCNKCNYEFDVFMQPHPHQSMSFLNIQTGGCPVCARAQAMSKVCPKCGSIDLNQTLANNNS